MSSGLLKGKILKILSSYSVVISLGREQGVKRGMRFIIYEEGEMIKDPETKADIEKLELVKGEVEITAVQEKISIAESFKTVKRVYDPLNISYIYPREVIDKEKKALTEEKIEEPSSPKVKVGDLVRQIEQ
jgi:hypothetical protein